MKRNLRQIAALVCCAVAGYLTIATSCLHDAERRTVSADVEFPERVTSKVFRLTVDSDSDVELSIKASHAVDIRIDPASVLPDAELDGGDLRGAGGVLNLTCYQVRCTDLQIGLERSDASEAVRSQLQIDLELSSDCNGEPPEYVEVELREVK